MKLLFGVAVATLLALLAGCSAPRGPVELQPGADGAYEIQMPPGSVFVPEEARVPVGARVVWVSSDNVAHDVTAEDDSWSSDQVPALSDKIQKGERYERTFDQAGTFAYKCRIHASTGMVGTLHVGPA